MTDINGTLFFVGSDPVNGLGLWRSDGTPQGTFFLRNFTSVGSIANANGTLYFSGNNTAGEYGLWTSDGTPQGTQRVVPLSAEPPGTSLGPISGAGGIVYFLRNGSTEHASSSDTIRVVDITAPAAPTGLVATTTPATGAAPGKVQLTWTDLASNNESGLVIERSLHPDFSTIDANFYAPQGVTTFADNQLSGAVNYYYRVHAINATGTSGPSPDALATFAVIRGSVFYDANYNGLRDAGEGPMANVTVFVDANGNGALDPGEIHTTSGPDGQFTLGGLATGGYLVREIVPAGDRRTARLLPRPALRDGRAGGRGARLRQRGAGYRPPQL